MAKLFSEPEVNVHPGETLHIPLLIRNPTDTQAQVALFVTLSPGWTAKFGEARFTVAAHDTYPVQTLAVAPADKSNAPQEVIWKAEANGKVIAAIPVRIYVSEDGMPQ